MTKAEIVNAIYTKVGGFSKKEAADIVELVFETVKETLGRGEKIKISGFGNFVLRDKRQRRGRNPQTGQPLTITERRVLTFKASQILKSMLNEEEEKKAEGKPDGKPQGLAAAQPAPHAPATTRDGRAPNNSSSTGTVSATVPAAAAARAMRGLNQNERR
jgi:integration host factor subunit alpha